MGAGRINFLKTGVLYADLITTVSPTYAHEIQSAEYGMGLEGLLRSRSDTVIGILNGVDYSEWNPETDPLIPGNYSRADRSGKSVCKRELMADLELQGGQDRPLIGIVSRLVGQKGFDLVGKVIPGLLTRRDFALAVLGSGERRFEQMFSRLQNAFRDRVCFYSGYSNKLAHWIEAGSDMFLMPSRYEPCGLNQMYSLRYGTVPIVRETGGLADSVELVDSKTGSGTGVLFRDYDEAGVAWAVNAGLDLYRNKPLWSRIIDNGMEKDFSWEHQGAHYVELFRRLSRSS
jgi:starch synthase